jgi:hypothetical protein
MIPQVMSEPNRILRLWPLINRTLVVILTNAISVVGVLFLGWPPFSLIVLFIAEAVVVLASDTIKSRFVRRARLIDKNLKEPANLLVEFFAILFGGIFSILSFSPHVEDYSFLSKTFRTAARLVATDLRFPILGIALLRLYRLKRDLEDAGVFGKKAQHPLKSDGREWMAILFFSVVLVAVFAKDKPSPKMGLFIILVLKTLGECFALRAMAGAVNLGGKKKSL